MLANMLLIATMAQSPDQYDELKERALYLTEQVKVLELEVQVRDTRRALNTNSFSLVRLLSYGAEWRAQFQVGDQLVELKVGERLTDELRITQIDYSGVTVANPYGTERTLPFGPNNPANLSLGAPIQ